MAKQPKSDRRSGDRHKPGRQMRVHPLIAFMLDELAERNATTAPQEGNRAMRELLRQEGLWPPNPELVKKWQARHAEAAKARKRKPPTETRP